MQDSHCRVIQVFFSFDLRQFCLQIYCLKLNEDVCMNRERSVREKGAEEEVSQLKVKYISFDFWIAVNIFFWIAIVLQKSKEL